MNRLDQIRALAKKLYHREGEIEIDDKAVVSESGRHGDNGAYVNAWVWVPFDGVKGLDKSRKEVR